MSTLENKKSETVEHFFSTIKELAQKLNFENCEEDIIRDIFITNKLDDDYVQRELLRYTVGTGESSQLCGKNGNAKSKATTILL